MHNLGGSDVAGILRHTHNNGQAECVFDTLRGAQYAEENSRMGANEEKLRRLGAEIRRRRKAMKMTLMELAFEIDGDNGNLSRLERGKQGYSDELLNKIAWALGCSVSDLFAGAEGESNVASVPLGTRRIPLISCVQAGAMTEAVDPYALGDASDWLLTDLELSANAFALRIKGDSMLPEFREGDTVIIDPAVQPLPGDFVVAKNGENEATFKKYRPRGINEQGQQVFELVPLNEDYPSMRSDLTAIRIIGTMVEHRRYRKR